jgi:hypothetical protein
MRQKLFFAFLLIAAIGNGGCSGSSGSQQLLPHQQVASNIDSAIDFMGRNHAMQFNAIALPGGFQPIAIMKDGAIPGSIADHAAVFSHGRLSLLKDYPGCTVGEQDRDFINTATSVNVHGEVVGYCNYHNVPSASAPSFVGIALYYKNGNVKALPYPIQDETLGSSVFSISINDLGVIAGGINQAGNFTSGLYRLYTDGTQATFIADAFSYIQTINDKNEIANTQGQATCCQATITSVTGQSTILIGPEPLCSISAWINDRNAVVGAYGCSTPRAYVYSGCGVTYLPAPAREATGINNAGDIVGAEVSGLFLYKNGILNSISSDIRPPGNYSVLTADCVACFAPYLGGLSEHDEFIATTGSGQFYLVKPSGKI